MFDEPWRPKEPLFPGLEWEHTKRSHVFFLGRWWCMSDGGPFHYYSNIVHTPDGADPMPWLRAECLKHLQACAKTMGVRVVTGEQLRELANAAIS